jgi:TetR/AcrR family transcriptional regulator
MSDVVGWRARVAARKVDPATKLALNSAREVSARIVDAANALMYESGSTNFTMQMLARRAQVSLASVYGHFSSKDGVILAVMEEVTEQLEEYLELSVATETDPVQRIRALIRGPIIGLSDREQRTLLIFQQEIWRLAETYPDAILAAIEFGPRILAREMEAAAALGLITSPNIGGDAGKLYQLIWSEWQFVLIGWVEDPAAAADELWDFASRTLSIC